MSQCKLLVFFVVVCIQAAGFATDATAGVVSEKAQFSFPDTVSDFDGCSSALARARRNALEKVCGVTVSGGSGRFRSEDVDELSLFTFEEVGGRIVAATHIRKKVDEQVNPVSGIGGSVTVKYQ
jgi:hypothetical protein